VIDRVLPSGTAAALITLLAITLVSTADSQLLVMSSSTVADLRTQRSEPSTAGARFLVLLSGVAALLLAYEWPGALGRYLLVWNLLGATFGPVLLVRLSGKRIRAGSMLGAMWAGCLLTLVFYVLPSGPGEFLDRVLPFVAALGIALTGGERRRNPDRADRAEATVHDHLPI
jgi:sodium/proline symporter